MRHVRAIVLGVLVAVCWSAATAAAPPTEPPAAPPAEPSTTVADGSATTLPATQTPPPIADPNVVSGPLIVVPDACEAPIPPVAVFVGTLAAADSTTARFAVEQIRAGTLDGYAVNTIVDVRYDDDIRFLHPGQQYLVGTAPDPVLHVLRSKVRVPAPLFGGDAVIGVNDSNVRCPRVEDGVKTLLVNGAGVDTGVLTPLKTAKRSLLKAILKPLIVALVVLVVLAAIKLLIFAMVRALRETDDDDTAERPEVPRDREHAF